MRGAFLSKRESVVAAGLMKFDAALEVVVREAAVLPLPQSERVGLLDVRSRVLAEAILADRDQPPFDRATRDGFAVRAEDIGAEVEVVGQVRAGERWTGKALESGQAIEIMTGAPMPDGSDAVLMVEHVGVSDGRVRPLDGRRLARGENVVPRGAEARLGDVVVAAGTTLGAAEIALAAVSGAADLVVYRRPRVAIVATGDELVELGETPAESQIRNSNSYGIAAMVEAAGGEAVRLPIARDTGEDLRARLLEARQCDLLLLSGGVSMGKYDLVEEVLAELGAEFFFTGVWMQPGKPVVFGRLPGAMDVRGMYFFGLPGNPVSTQVTFHCFAEPLLHALCGAEVEGPRFVQATLSEDVAGKPGLMRLLPARLNGRRVSPEVRLVGWQGSGDLAANARANCYAVLPGEVNGFCAGDVISVLLR